MSEQDYKKLQKFQQDYEHLTNTVVEDLWSKWKEAYPEKTRFFNWDGSWEVGYDHITFSGDEGAMGCYDPSAQSIPLAYVKNFDAAFEEEEQRTKACARKLKKEREARKKKEAEETEAHDKKEYERLKKKFDTRNSLV